jgi:phosphoribosylformylglycinamidine (FGAM) synthase-like enzyme
MAVSSISTVDGWSRKPAGSETVSTIQKAITAHLVAAAMMRPVRGGCARAVAEMSTTAAMGVSSSLRVPPEQGKRLQAMTGPASDLSQ